MTVAIIGIGLIGGSLAITLKENGFADTIIGVDKSQQNLDKAIRRRLIDMDCSLEEAMQRSDLIVIATPVNALMDLVPQILDLTQPHQVVLDVGSTKELLLNIIKHHPRRGRFVPTHPMAGTEHSGPEAAVPNLFDHKYTFKFYVKVNKISSKVRLYAKIASFLLFLFLFNWIGIKIGT